MFNCNLQISGIYCIKNIITETVYIGSSINIKQRWYKHIKQLQNNMHPNSYLQNAWNKYGKSNFKFSILKRVNNKKLLVEEQIYLNTIKNKYNIRKDASSNLGLKMSKATKLRHYISTKRRWVLWRKDHPKPIKIIKKRIPWNKGKKLSKWICRKFSDAKIKSPMNYWSGKKRSLETIKKISKKLKGRKLSTKHVKNIGLSHKGLSYKKR